ncbi:peptidase family protein [Durotheca rogersii]|uniref:peptidase family protein n=1 Tax=Durotheca rogersii TaxID=419775 RepID=UPI00221F3124|nr:peptidase family protein [Durotheca rogersii]KAI5867534.1 peptidase family protein [Durotheca rogersii]
MKDSACSALLGLAGYAISAQSQRPLGLPSAQSDLLRLHKSLVEIESISRNEHDVAVFLAKYLQQQGLKTTLQPIPGYPKRLNVIGWPGLKPYPTAAGVLVTSDIDTVPPFLPYRIGAQGTDVNASTAIRGRGGVGAKASVAARVVAVREVLRSGAIHNGDAALLYVVGEEHDAAVMRAFSGAVQAAVFGEPTENKLACGHRGHAACTVRAHGVAGHSGYPLLGESAIEVLVRGLGAIMDAGFGRSEEFGNATINIGLISGGVAVSVIPEAAEAAVNVRVATGPEEGGDQVAIKEALVVECKRGRGAVYADFLVANEYFQALKKGDYKRHLYGPETILVAHLDHEALTVGELEEGVEGFKKRRESGVDEDE